MVDFFPRKMEFALRSSWGGGPVFKRVCFSVFLLLSSASLGGAGLLQWSVDKQSDPFSGGDSVSVSFMSSFRSGVLLLCDSAHEGLTVRSIPGFDYDDKLDGFTPTVKFAFDGKLLFNTEGRVGKVGNNLAISEAELKGSQAKQFVDAFASAKKQTAIDDGISDKPQLLTANGSTASGAAILACISKQVAE
jgi:hypothetical protein